MGRPLTILLTGPLLALTVSSCGLLPPRRPLGTATPLPRPTATPAPLAAASGSASSIIPHLVAPGPWSARWYYSCRGPHWLISMEAHPTRRNVRPATVIVAHARAPSPRSARGTTLMPDRGNLYVTIRSAGCHWQLVALP